MSDFQKTEAVTEQWHDLVEAAEQNHGMSLNDDIESYLLFSIAKNTKHPGQAVKIMAMAYLRGAQQSVVMQQAGKHESENFSSVSLNYYLKYYMELVRGVYRVIIAATQRR